MIYSSINDNWMRVEIMHSVAHKYYLSSLDTDYRKRRINGEPPREFFSPNHDPMEKESCLVGMVMAWSVITLESLVNHSLAEMLNNKTSAIMATEYPSQIIEKLKIAKSARSELAKKLLILSDNNEQITKYLPLADELSDTRNRIVHDKPFEYIDLGEGEFEITHFRSRGDALEKRTLYDDLGDFYGKCEEIKSYIDSISCILGIDVEDISFTKLLNT